MRFADPMWLWVGSASVLVLAALLVRAEHRRSRALAALAGSRLRGTGAELPSPFRRWLRAAVITGSVALGFVALARPQKGLHWETMDRKGTDLFLVVDTSRSMDADDVKPTRLERAKLAIRDLVAKFPGDRIGVVAFAGDAFVQSPMTLDHEALLETVDALDTSVVARGGTDIGRAIDVATAALASEPEHQKEMVLLTDGEDLERSGVEEAKKAGSMGITIDAVGVGSPGGELVPARDDKGRVIGVVQDEDGKPVRSKLDEAGLSAIAAAANGTYRPLGQDGQGLERLYQQSLAPRARVERSSLTRRVYSERYQLPLGLATLGIIVDSLLGVRWRRTTRRRRQPATVAMALLSGLALFVIPGSALASVSAATRAYATGHFDEAAKAYAAESDSHPKDVRLAFNAGDAAYRAKHYEAAGKLFERALSAAEPALKEHVLYNEGDVLYRSGEEHLNDGRDETIAQWKAAITAYDTALGLNPKDGDARFNRDFVKRKLAELEKKQQEEQKSQQKNDPNEQKQDGKSGGGGKAQDSKGKGGKDAKTSPPRDGTAKDDASAKSGGAEAKGGPGHQPKDDPSGKGTNPSPTSPSPTAQKDARPPSGGTKDDGAQARPGELSPRDARAMLGALKGGERHHVQYGSEGAKAVDDTPRKDW